MKRLEWLLGLLLLAAVPVFMWVHTAGAQRFSNTVEEDQKVHSSLYSSGKQIDIKGEIFGDVFCAGQTIEIDAIVHGDVICAGQDVTIAGTVDGDIRVAGQLVALEANVNRNATIAAMSFSLDAGAKIGQDVTAVGSDLNLKGAIGRDAVVTGSSVIFNGTVGRTVTAQGDQITLKRSARIAGNLKYASTNQAKFEQGADVAGKTVHTVPKKESWHFSFSPAFYLTVLVSLVLLGVGLALCFPRLLRQASERLHRTYIKSFFLGIAVALLLPFIAFLLALTIIGIPLTLFLIVSFILMSFLSGPTVGYHVGRLLLKKHKNPVLLAAVGGAVLITLYFIPFIGVFIMFTVYLMGLGVLLLELVSVIRANRTA